MAEILIKLQDAVAADPAKDSLCYKRGDPVVVMPDGHSWGREECPPRFAVVKIPGMSISDAKKYIEPERSTLLDALGDHPIIRRRTFRFLIDTIPADIKNRLLAEGSATITKNQAGNFLKSKAMLIGDSWRP